MCWAKNYFSWQKGALKKTPKCAAAETEQNSNHCNSVQSPKVSTESSSTQRAEHPNLGILESAPQSTLTHVTGTAQSSPQFKAGGSQFGDITASNASWESAPLQICVLQLSAQDLCHIKALLQNFYHTVLFMMHDFITQCHWFQHMFMGTACYLLFKQCLMLHIPVMGN